jgi:uncharacterized protein YndB with AHSA1/START domain
MDLVAKTYIKVKRPVAEVFDAVVDPAKMASYFITSGSARMETGRTVTWYWADYGDAKLDVDVERVTPTTSIAWSWRASGAGTRVEMTFEPLAGDLTKVSVAEDGWDKTDAGIAKLAENMQGWTQFMCGLKAFVEHGINIRKDAY